MPVDRGRASAKQGCSAGAGGHGLSERRSPRLLAALLVDFVLGLLQVVAGCHAFLSLPEARWQLMTEEWLLEGRLLSQPRQRT